MPTAPKLLLALLAALAAPAALAAERSLHFYGYAYDLETDAYLYTEVHRQKLVDGHWASGTVEYFLPGGEPLGSKVMDFSQDEFVPVFRLDLPLLGYTEAITSAAPQLVMERRRAAGAQAQGKTFERRAPLCADSGLILFLRSRFAELMDGGSVDFRLAVAGSLDTFKFRARRMEDTTFEGRPAVRFRVAPNSLLRLVAKPLELTYDASKRKLLEYRGISSVRDAATGAPYKVRVAYYSTPPAAATHRPPLDCTLPDCGLPDVD